MPTFFSKKTHNKTKLSYNETELSPLYSLPDQSKLQAIWKMIEEKEENIKTFYPKWQSYKDALRTELLTTLPQYHIELVCNCCPQFRNKVNSDPFKKEALYALEWTVTVINASPNKEQVATSLNQLHMFLQNIINPPSLQSPNSKNSPVDPQYRERTRQALMPRR